MKKVFFWLLAIASIAAYILTKSTLIGALALAMLLAAIALDVLPRSAAFRDIASSLFDAAIALVCAAVLWLALSVLLATPSPLDVVTSCSMAPNLNRGDLLILKGEAINVTTLNYTNAFPRIGLVKVPCALVGEGVRQTLCTKALLIDNRTHELSRGDVIVFRHGDELIVHRVVFALQNATSGDVVYLTKGDNNPALDQEAGIPPIARNAILGRVVVALPFLGYVKLLLFLQLKEPENCRWRIFETQPKALIGA